MRYKLGILCTMLLCTMLLFVACNKEKQISVTEAIANGTYDWESARKSCINDVTTVLNVVIAGDVEHYTNIRNEWLSRVQSNVQGVMFPMTSPPQGCSSAIHYLGYSAPDCNSEGVEYLLYKARCMNNATLESVDYRIVVTIGQGKTGYIITGFTKELWNEV